MGTGTSGAPRGPGRPRERRRGSRRWRRPVAAVLAASVVLVIGVAGTARLDADPAAASREEPTAPAAAAPPEVAAAPEVAPAPTVPPAPDPVVLPTPEPLPIDPRAATPDVVIGAIEIPRLGVFEVLRQGMTLTAIDRGPSHWPGTALPGQVGNVVVGGHRSTHSQPFRHLDALVPGDLARFHTGDGTFVYEVTGTEIVTPDTLSIADQTADHTATLFACHPVGSTRERIVVHLRLVADAERSADGARATLAA